MDKIEGDYKTYTDKELVDLHKRFLAIVANGHSGENFENKTWKQIALIEMEIVRREELK